MLTYQYVEEYLEILGGYDVTNSYSGLLFPSNKRISLARYDIAIVDSMSSHTVFGGTLTDRQAELCVKIILKYRRQFAKLNIDVTPVENPIFRLTPRKLDRSRRMWLDDQRIGIRFPYDRALIDTLQEYKKTSQGSTSWDNEEKIWWFGLTEANVNWAVTWGSANQFDIDPLMQQVMAQILKCEDTVYEIKLVRTATGYEITNAADGLVEYINENLGGFGLDNKIKLVDAAGTLGYTIDDGILIDCSESMRYIGQRHSVHFPPSDKNLEMIFEYAELTDRYPICIYNPTLIDIDISKFDEKDIVRFDRNGRTKTPDYDPYNIKIIYAQKIPTTWDFPVPLLLTTFEMMYGGKKMDWTQRAEKIVYYCNTTLRTD